MLLPQGVHVSWKRREECPAGGELFSARVSERGGVECQGRERALARVASISQSVVPAAPGRLQGPYLSPRELWSTIVLARTSQLAREELTPVA